MCAVHKRMLTVLSSEKAPARRKRPWQFADFVFLGRRRRPYIVFRNRFLYGFMFVYIYIYIYIYICMYIYICQDGGVVGFVEFTKLLFALSSLAQPLKRVRSIP